jgi:hypothetical protein
LWAAFQEKGLAAEVTISVDHLLPGARVPMVFVGYRSGVQRNRPDEIATWQPFEKTVRFDPRPKRVPLDGSRDDGFIRTIPAPNGGHLNALGVDATLELSAPYQRLQRKEQEKDLVYEQPDHVQGLHEFLGTFAE